MLDKWLPLKYASLGPRGSGGTLRLIVVVVRFLFAASALRVIGLLMFMLFSLLDLFVSSLRRGHANILCIVPSLTDDPRRES